MAADLLPVMAVTASCFVELALWGVPIRLYGPRLPPRRWVMAVFPSFSFDDCGQQNRAAVCQLSPQTGLVHDTQDAPQHNATLRSDAVRDGAKQETAVCTRDKQCGLTALRINCRSCGVGPQCTEHGETHTDRICVRYTWQYDTKTYRPIASSRVLRTGRKP